MFCLEMFISNFLIFSKPMIVKITERLTTQNLGRSATSFSFPHVSWYNGQSPCFQSLVLEESDLNVNTDLKADVVPSFEKGSNLRLDLPTHNYFLVISAMGQH